jgi:multicomponent Na+:H+ antiporter subunit E
MVRWMRSAVAVLVFWLVLAVPAGPVDLAWGVVVAMLVGPWAAAFLWPGEGAGGGLGARRLPRLLVHGLDLLRAIVPAALQLIGILVGRRLAIRPRVITYTTKLTSEAARVALANSITLTPGTHCVDLRGDELTVHCLDPSFAESLLSGKVEADIRRVFEPGDDR